MSLRKTALIQLFSPAVRRLLSLGSSWACHPGRQVNEAAGVICQSPGQTAHLYPGSPARMAGPDAVLFAPPPQRPPARDVELKLAGGEAEVAEVDGRQTELGPPISDGAIVLRLAHRDPLLALQRTKA